MRNNVRQLDTASEMAHEIWDLHIPDGAFYDKEGPRITEVTIHRSNTLALTLSSELARKIQRALCLGRVQRLLAPGINKDIKKAENLQIDQATKLEIHGFYANLLKRNMENEPGGPTIQQKTDYEKAIGSIHTARYNQKVALSNLESAKSEANLHMTEWTDALAAVEKILDEVWTEAKWLKPPGQGDRSSDDSSDDGAGDPPPQPSPSPQSPDRGGCGGCGGAPTYDDDGAGDPPPQSPDHGGWVGAPPYDDRGRGRSPSIEHDQGIDAGGPPRRMDLYGGNWRRAYPEADGPPHRMDLYPGIRGRAYPEVDGPPRRMDDFHSEIPRAGHPVRSNPPRWSDPPEIFGSEPHETPNLYEEAESNQVRLSSGIKRKRSVEISEDELLPAQRTADRELRRAEPDLVEAEIGKLPPASIERENNDSLPSQKRRKGIGSNVSIQDIFLANGGGAPR